MSIFDRALGALGIVNPVTKPAFSAPRAATQELVGISITSSEQLEAALRSGNVSAAGAAVTAESAMRVATVYGCVRLISGAVATLPIHVKRRIDDNTREDASESRLWRLLRAKPNRWQKPAQFKRMMQAHVLLTGNAYAAKVWGVGGDVVELIPMNPWRMTVTQQADMALEYVYRRPDGQRVRFAAEDVLHLYKLSLNGFTGVSPITYARESIGLALSMERHGGSVFRNGASPTGVLKAEKRLDDQQIEKLKTDLDEYRSGGAAEGRTLVLENGLSFEKIGMTAEDAQWLESRAFTRTEIMMFYGVPPHMLGDNEKNTSFGAGLEQQTQGFVSWTLEDDLTMWEEALTLDCQRRPETSAIYVRFNRNALIRADMKTRTEAYARALQWGWANPDEVRALEDTNPRSDGLGARYYDPPNMAGGEPGGETRQ